MPKKRGLPRSRHARAVAELIGLRIRNARIECRMTADELAARAGVSRGCVHRIEKGEMGCAIGTVLELAALLRVRLLEEESSGLARCLDMARDKAALLPKSARGGIWSAADGE